MDKARMNAKLAIAIAAALGAPLGAEVTQAQDVQVQVESGGLEEVVVTARKREENLQDLGTAFSAMGQAELNRRFDVDLQDFANAAPNVVIDDLQQGPGSPAAIAIRGIGTTDVEKNFDPTVGVVVDGVFIGANSGAMLKAIDLQSVEILRGPQGTLFGRNSIAGVINVTRQRPQTEFGGGVRLGYGNYDDKQLDGYVNIPMGEQFAFKISGAYRERDGYFDNLTLGRESGEMEYKSISPSLMWRPSDSLEFYYRYDDSQQDQDANTVQNMAQPNQVFCDRYLQCAQGVTTPQSGDRYDVLQNGDRHDSFFDSEMHIFNARWDISDANRLEYLFGYFTTDEEVYQDWDGTPLTLYHTERPAVYTQRSHELRLTHDADGALTYTVGAYVWNSSYRIDLLSEIGFADFLFPGVVLPGTVVPVPQTVQQHTDSYAAFVEADYAFNDAWTLTLGGRYTKDEKDSGLIDPTMPQLATLGSLDNPFEEEWDEFTPKAGLRYRVSPDLMFFGLYSKGYRSGGFSGRANTYDAASKPYDPETVDNYEIGMKSEWMDRRLRLNASAYFMKYNDKQEELSEQAPVGTGQQTVVLNASSAEITGLEIELLTTPFDGFTLSASLGLLDSEYKDFADPIDGRDLTFLKLRRAPDMTATIAPTYEWDMLGGQMWVTASWHYIDELELTFYNTPQSQNPEQNIFDASLNYQFNNTTVSAYGMNLSDEDSWSVGFDVGASLDFAGLWTYTATRPPRTYGFRLTQKF